MVKAFVDTTVLVDLLRQHSPAVTWMQTQSQPEFGITPGVWMELVFGAQNKVAQRHAMTLLAKFEMVYFTQADMDWAMQQLLAFRLKHNVGILDCLIASVSHRLKLPLYTHNLKHFVPLLDSLAQQPY